MVCNQFFTHAGCREHEDMSCKMMEAIIDEKVPTA